MLCIVWGFRPERARPIVAVVVVAIVSATRAGVSNW